MRENILMSNSFADLFEASLKQDKVYPGAIVKGKVIAIDSDNVIVHAGLKSEGYIPKTQFLNDKGELEVSVGDEVDVALDAVEDGWGATRLSREKAKRAKAWIDLAEIHKKGEIVVGTITGKVKGGFTVELENIRAFLPGSLVDSKPIKDFSEIDGKEMEFKLIKLDQKRNNVVVSRRSILDTENSAERAELLDSLSEGQEVSGVVKNLTDYGAFVDLGGIDGLLHITDMAWKRVKHPSEVVKVGQELQVKVLKFDKDKTRVSLGLKQLGDDPWGEIKDKYIKGSRLKGKVTNVTDYGCFVELEDGVEGLVHVSEMDWTNKNIHPSKVVQLGLDVDVMVLEVDEDRRRISLGLKQCQNNPWENFDSTHQKGDKVSGKIKSITDFGVFIGLEGGIDGLIHLSDLSWDDNGEEVVKDLKKGQELEAVVLGVDVERERISLGVKQVGQDPFGMFLTDNAKGSIVSGTVISVDVKGAVISLADTVEGYLKANDFSRDKVEDLTQELKEGDKIEAKITNIDKKNRSINLSIKAKDEQEEKEALKELSRTSEEASSMKLGDLFKQQMENK